MHFRALENADDYRGFRELEDSRFGIFFVDAVPVEPLEDLFISSFELLLPFPELFVGITSSMVELIV